ncbi:glycerol-3-phosphate responsive antiterminator [Anaerocolumna jejuensis]|uniref:glycerol-3-phosphate responsive antiterminator n=1 Tax=Anaerocolumna jejuensis TaxID=259063 RepID=UPI003F7B375B
MKRRFVNIIEDNPVIAAVKDEEGLEKSIQSDGIGVIFVLYGDICNIERIVSRIKEEGRIAIVHIDLITGLSGKDVSIDFIKQNTKADGIITTKQTLIKHAKELGLYTVLRYFVIDSMALFNIEKQSSLIQPDVIEILPGAMPKILKKISETSKVPIIAGGLISDKDDVMAALSSGAISISTTNSNVWVL